MTGALLLSFFLAAQAGDSDAFAKGRREFETLCGACHGADGMGGERAPAVGSRRRNRLRQENALRDLIRAGIPDSGMPGFTLPNERLDPLILFVRSRIAPARETAVAGDPRAGEAIFFGKGGCSSCHMMRGRGGLNGPDLTNAGLDLTLAEIEQSIRNPDARRKPGYQVVTAELRSGGVVRGFLRNESTFDMQIQSFDGKLHLLTRAETVAVRREPKSYMPPGEVNADLLAFLTNPPAPRERPAETSGWNEILHPKAGDWPTYHGQLGGNRSSSLTEITPANVNQLAPRWIFPIPSARRLEGTPVAVDGVLYVTNVNEAWALDGANGREIWHYARPRSQGLVGDAASGINRGVAVLGDRLFMVTDNAHLIALHRLSGALLWDVEMADSAKHYGATSAPLVVNDLVVSGISGGDEGVRGFLAAYRASTGERVWRFWTVPAPEDPAARTWNGKAELEHACASTWLTGTYDHETGTLFWPTGNPCADYNGDERQGDNLYSDSVLALEPATGRLKWHFQFTPHDTHDWDATETLMIVDAPYQGRDRKLLLEANRNGFFYVLDRTNGQFLSATPFVHALTWASGIGQDGRPLLLPGSDPTPQGARVCPAVEGASNWMSTAFLPASGLFYVMALESCNIFSKTPQVWKKGESFYGGGTRKAAGEPPRKYLRAIDVQSGKIAWEVLQTGPANTWGGVLATVTGLVFYCDDSGAFASVSAKTGEPLWDMQLNASWHSSPMTYTAKGKQYIAIATGSEIVSFALPQPRERVP